MKLDDVLALHPRGAGAATLRGAIEKAEALRADLLARAADLDRQRVEGLLTLENKTILKAEADAAEARLTADRIEALLPAIRAELHATEGLEALAALRAEAEAVGRVCAEVEAWQRDAMPQITPLIWEGIRLEREADEARARLRARVQAAYEHQAVRDAGPLGIDLPALTSRAPSSLFPNWR